MKLNAKQTIRQIVSFIVRYRVILIWLVVLCLLGLTLWRLQAISDPEPDAHYINKQRENPENQVEKIQLPDELRRNIEQLQPNPVDVDPDQLGTQDPFNP